MLRILGDVYILCPSAYIIYAECNYLRTAKSGPRKHEPHPLPSRGFVSRVSSATHIIPELYCQ